MATRSSTTIRTRSKTHKIRAPKELIATPATPIRRQRVNTTPTAPVTAPPSVVKSSRRPRPPTLSPDADRPSELLSCDVKSARRPRPPTLSPDADRPSELLSCDSEAGESLPCEDEADELYEVGEIHDMSITANGDEVARKFFVSWVGYDDRTWEPEENLPVAMVAQYLQHVGQNELELAESAKSSVRCGSIGADSIFTNLVAATSKITQPTSPDADGAALEDHSEAPPPMDEDGEESKGATDHMAADIYEVDCIHEMKTARRNREEIRMFLVSWVGYEEHTWEPESNLPTNMVDAYLKTIEARAGAMPTIGNDAIVTGDRDPEEVGCAACGDPGGLGSSCVKCKKPMHHFCASDVCQSLQLKDASGDDLVEFPNDVCYCSIKCYQQSQGVAYVSTTKRHAAGRDKDVSASEGKRKRVRAAVGRDKRVSISAGKRKRVRGPDSSPSDYDTPGAGLSDSDDSNVDATVARTVLRKATATKNVKQSSTPAPKKKSESLKKSKKHQTPATALDVPPQSWPPPKPKNATAKAKTTEVPATRDPLVGKMVAFCADNEEWMPNKLYSEAKGLYLTGRVFVPKHVVGQKDDASVYEVRWTVTKFQSKQFIHKKVTRSKIEEGIRNHATIAGGVLNTATWQHICRVPESEESKLDDSLDDFVILDGSSDLFVSHQALPDNLQLVEQIKSLDFQPSRRMKEPSDLFTHEDGTIETKLIKEQAHHFDTASSSFFAYLPISFWRTVVCESNEYAGASKNALITLDELMRFFGIMFYMTIIAKGEYANYWGDQAESEIFGLTGSGLGLDHVMTLRRFQFIRKNLCFRCTVTPEELKKDAAARIRPLINIIKITSTRYVVVGRNVAVDESSIACRSKYGRHLIVYNSSKPTGKYHFKIYACCCSTTWIMVGFRLHCTSDMEERLDGVVPASTIRYLEDSLQFSSSVRQIVLEVTQPLHGSNRIVNTDNFYTSVTLLLSLRDVGMYGRGTVREKSKHFPQAHMFAKKSTAPRGSSLQGVSSTGQLVAASWMDGSTVNIISNADSSSMGEVTRLVGKQKVAFPAPKCVAEYNKHMQGVDRLDQLRAKYSLADGHSMQKWHKKLALAFIDIARVNAYVTKGLRDSDRKPSRNAHRDFMIELATELITGKWKDTVDDDGMLYADEATSSASITASSPRAMSAPPTPTEPACEFELSSDVFPDSTRGKRGCKVCKFEGRVWTMKTNYCRQHNVCLCSKTYPIDPALASVVCPHEGWSCWRKYHEFYLPRGLFNRHGRIKRSSTLHKARRELQLVETEEKTATEVPTLFSAYTPFQSSPYAPAASPPTLVFSPFDSVRANALAEVDYDMSEEVQSPPQLPWTPGLSAVSSSSTVYI